MKIEFTVPAVNDLRVRSAGAVPETMALMSEVPLVGAILVYADAVPKAADPTDLPSTVAATVPVPPFRPLTTRTFTVFVVLVDGVFVSVISVAAGAPTVAVTINV